LNASIVGSSFSTPENEVSKVSEQTYAFSPMTNFPSGNFRMTRLIFVFLHAAMSFASPGAARAA